MYMNLKANQHKRISFNTTTMTSLGSIVPPKVLGPPLNPLNLVPPPPPPKKKLIFCSGLLPLPPIILV